MNTSTTTHSGYVSIEFAPQLKYFSKVQNIWIWTLENKSTFGSSNQEKFSQIINDSFHQGLSISNCLKRLLIELD